MIAGILHAHEPTFPVTSPTHRLSREQSHRRHTFYAPSPRQPTIVRCGVRGGDTRSPLRHTCLPNSAGRCNAAHGVERGAGNSETRHARHGQTLAASTATDDCVSWLPAAPGNWFWRLRSVVAGRRIRSERAHVTKPSRADLCAARSTV